MPPGRLGFETGCSGAPLPHALPTLWVSPGTHSTCSRGKERNGWPGTQACVL